MTELAVQLKVLRTAWKRLNCSKNDLKVDKTGAGIRKFSGDYDDLMETSDE